MDHYDIAIIGAGLAGSLAAIALAREGHRVALVGPRPAIVDGRTTALMDQSIEYLKKLDLWGEVEPLTAPLVAIRILDGTTRLFRAPPVNFRASEVGLDAFGYNIPNAPFLEILERHEAGLPTLERATAAATRFDIDGAEVRIGLGDDRSITADLVVGADGRRSAVREAAGIGVRTWSYPQAAIVLNFSHELPHQDVSTEFHTEGGPFTQVPLPGNRSSLVWVRKPRDAEQTLTLAPDVLSRTIEDRMQSILGKVRRRECRIISAFRPFRPSFRQGPHPARRRSRPCLSPIGAQGLNLSLRDIMTLVDLIGRPTGSRLPADTGDRFDGRRRADILSRTASVDLLNRSLLSNFLPVQALRAAGLHLLSSAGPLRGLLMREGIHPGSALQAFKEGLREQIRRKSA